MPIDWTNPTVQGALVGGLAGVLGGLVGGFVGGLFAWLVSRANRTADAKARDQAREDARQHRFADDVVLRSAELLRRASEHRREIEAEVASRVWDEQPRPLANKPTVGSTEPVYLLQAELHLIARRPETAAAAYQLYLATVTLDDWAFNPKNDLLPEDKVKPIQKDSYWEFYEHVKQFARTSDVFIREVRAELGRDAFGDHKKVTP